MTMIFILCHSHIGQAVGLQSMDQSQTATTSRALEHQAPTSKGHSSLQIKKSTIMESGATLSTQANEVFKMVEMWNTYHGFVLKLNDNVLLKIYFN